MNSIIALRHELHRYPEISNQEFKTSERISQFMARLHADEVITLGKTGKAFVFKGKEEGQTVVFRAELDALPIQEAGKNEYTSVNQGVAHVCGHDGHMAIVAGLAKRVAENRPVKGKVVILFQPAEEVEQGARDVVNDPGFQKLKPDYIFALHNVPGVKKHTILIKRGSFAAASRGMTVKLTGKTSHAAEPEKGISPAIAISEIIKELNLLIKDKSLFKDLSLLTIIHVQLGEISFGTTPGYAEIRITLRAFENDDMELLCKKAENIITNIAQAEKLRCDLSYSEVFPATVNNNECIELIEEAINKNGFNSTLIEKPFKWSEDFGYFTGKYKGGFFGLGSGTEQPALHNPDFDFPDEIISTGENVFYSIYKKINLND